MKDAKTLKLAYRPVTAEALGKYIRLMQFELAGTPPGAALKQVGISADDVTRIAAAVNLFCRPRLLRQRLAMATAKNAERRQKQQEQLAAPIDDSDFVELYGRSSHDVFKPLEADLVALRSQLALATGRNGLKS